MASLLTENFVKPVVGIYPVADAFAGTVYSDVINASQAQWITALVYWGVGATGTTTITVIPCDDVTPSNRGTAVAFTYRIYSTDTDVAGAATAATSSGILTVAGSDKVYAIEIDPAVLGASGYKYVQIKCVESVDSPLLGGILFLVQPTYASKAVATMLT
jgi:hypothetical protein